MLKTNLFKLIILISLVGSAIESPGVAGNEINISEVEVAYTIGESVDIRAKYPAELSVERISILLKIGETGDTYASETEFDTNGLIRYSHDLQEKPFELFQTISFWFELLLVGGERVTSSSFTFVYEDNRFQWDIVENPPFVIHYYNGDNTFAQDIGDIAHSGLLQIQQYLPLSLPNKIDIYVYASTADMLSSEVENSAPWVNGRPDPATGAVMVSMPEGADHRLEMERVLPHEIAHVMLYASTGDDYANIPFWFTEGFSTIVERYQNPNNDIILVSAFEDDTLYSIEAICSPLPTGTTEPQMAQAYAQAASFVRYLFAEYSSSGMQTLLNLYSDGMSCVRGTQEAFGLPLHQLDRRWRQEQFSESIISKPANLFSPWILLLAFILLIPLWIIVNRIFSLYLQKGEA